jgi:hypothetical protein
MLGKLKKNAGLFRRFTGLEVAQFDDLVSKLEPIYAENETRRLKKLVRQRKIGGGSQFSRGLDERLLILLMYYKMYITHEFLGILFDLDNSNISRSIRHLNPLLARIFKVPERRILLSDKEKDEMLHIFLTARNSR